MKKYLFCIWTCTIQEVFVKEKSNFDYFKSFFVKKLIAVWIFQALFPPYNFTQIRWFSIYLSNKTGGSGWGRNHNTHSSISNSRSPNERKSGENFFLATKVLFFWFSRKKKKLLVWLIVDERRFRLSFLHFFSPFNISYFLSFGY